MAAGAQTTAQEEEQFSSAYQLLKTEHHQESKRIFKQLAAKTSSDIIRVKSLTALAQYYTIYFPIDSAIYFSHKALSILKGRLDEISLKRKAIIYNSLGIAHQKKGEFDASIAWHIKGIEVSEKVQYDRVYYQHTHGLAFSYYLKGENAKAKQLFKECLGSGNNLQLVYGSCLNLGMIHQQEGSFQQAVEYLERARLLCEKAGDRECVIVAFINMAESLIKQGKIPEAFDYLVQAEEIARQSGMLPYLTDARILKGDLYLELQNYAAAEEEWKSSLKEALDLGDFERITSVYRKLEELAERKGHFDQAHSYLKRRVNYQDSVRATQESEKIHELEVRYFTLKKEKEILVLKAQQARKELEIENHKKAFRNLQLEKELEKRAQEHSILLLKHDSTVSKGKIDRLTAEKHFQAQQAERRRTVNRLVGSSGLLIFMLMLLLLQSNRKKLKTQTLLNEKSKEANRQRITSILQKNELDLFRAEVQGENRERERIARELHDSIGGNLASIRLQVADLEHLCPKLPGVNEQINDTYEQVRFISHSLIPRKFRKEGFVSMLRKYAASIEKACKLKLYLSFFPEEEINGLEEELLTELYKIFQELVSNTVKHACADEVSFQLNILEGVLGFLYEDDGVGFDKENLCSGIGLDNIRNRISRLSGELHVDSQKDQGVVFSIEIPLKSNMNEDIQPADCR
ncbi:MAG: tetratricopeptide repeat protein [Cytophagales bacterium]|nr:tetratricopeptide repeat protein [Cytophagales bacterium]